MPPTPGPVLGRLDQKLVGPKQVPSARGATRDQGGVRRHRVHKGVGGAGTLQPVAASVRTMAPLTGAAEAHKTRQRTAAVTNIITQRHSQAAAVAATTNERKT